MQTFGGGGGGGGGANKVYYGRCGNGECDSFTTGVLFTEEKKALHAAQALSLNLTNNPIWRRIIRVSMRFSTRSDIYGGS